MAEKDQLLAHLTTTPPHLSGGLPRLSAAEHMAKCCDHICTRMMDSRLTLECCRLGVICIILCLAVGISNLLHASILILFGALCM